MAKGKRKRGKKHSGGGGGRGAPSGAFWAQLVRETIGNFAGHLMADGAEQMARSTDTTADEADEERDVAAAVLCALVESGPKSIGELVTETNASLTPLLDALRQTREFGLVEFVGDDQAVQLTPSGARTAAALRREQINSDGMKLLES